MSTWLRAVAAVGVSLAAACAAAPSTRAPEWRLTRALSDAEKNEVLALARRLDLGQPATIFDEFIHYPSRCTALRVESMRDVMGRRISWKRVWVTNPERPGWCHGGGPDSRRVGGWMAAERVEDVGAWRIPVDGGAIDVETSLTMPYAHAAVIVAAVHENRLVNRLLPGSEDVDRIYTLNVKSIFAIMRCDFCFLDPALSDPALYKVYSREPNLFLLVVVRGNAVELRFLGREMA